MRDGSQCPGTARVRWRDGCQPRRGLGDRVARGWAADSNGEQRRADDGRVAQHSSGGKGAGWTMEPRLASCRTSTDAIPRRLTLGRRRHRDRPGLADSQRGPCRIWSSTRCGSRSADGRCESASSCGRCLMERLEGLTNVTGLLRRADSAARASLRQLSVVSMSR